MLSPVATCLVRKDWTSLRWRKGGITILGIPLVNLTACEIRHLWASSRVEPYRREGGRSHNLIHDVEQECTRSQ
jgi:hypothetical protein